MGPAQVFSERRGYENRLECGGPGGAGVGERRMETDEDKNRGEKGDRMETW